MIQINMQMPEKCGLCPCFHFENPMYCQAVKADKNKKIVNPYGSQRPEWCPLKEQIQCKDCEYGKPLLDENAVDENTIKFAHLFECHKMHDWCTDNIECHDGNWFCADGKRKEGR